jgi:uncharacterized protein YecE (DUF72 family)
MPRRKASHGQLDLFAAPEAEPAPRVVGPAAVPPELVALGRALPEGVYLGTSSWSFPGWHGLLYDCAASQSHLARYGLAAYAQHPVLRAVGIDRTYYAPLAAADLAAYADVVPETFKFLVKAHALCTRITAPMHGRAEPGSNEPNTLFLDASYAAEQVIGPCLEGLGRKLGPILFQFPPQDVRTIGGPEQFVARLHAFLQALPRGPLYAVELRNRELLTPAYAAALADAGVCHCYNVHPRMPAVEEQQQLVPPSATPALVVRWMLHHGLGYDSARVRYEPFDRLVDPDPVHRTAIAALCVSTRAAGRAAFVIVNNKAEGSAPLTLFRLAARIVELTGGAGQE